ncbi:MAG TPA: MG2 domain-containing protein, partial [Gemmataceae bacterium]|nr:MG2 domain-containing protein [Gemmataceae bacterium]
MHGDRCTSRPGSPWRLMAVVGAVTIAALGFWQAASQAETTTLSSRDAAAIVHGNQIILSIPLKRPEKEHLRGTLQVELRDTRGDVVASAERSIDQAEPIVGHRVALDKPAKTDKLTVHCQFGHKEWTAPLADLLLVKGHETALITGQEFFAGSTGSIRVDVHAVKSITDNVPLPGADVTVDLKGSDGKIVNLLHQKTDTDGLVLGQFRVPALDAGNYTMQVATHSAFGQETLERQVKIKNDAKILLVSDKPIYQPGQVMHLRALALQAFDLAPMRERELTFEIEDGKGNKVFKRTAKTSAYGVTAADFQLADEVNMGDYHIRAILGAQQAEKTVTVKKYVLPKFKSELKADKQFYMPKETIHVDLQSDYFFGKPVANAKVHVAASTFDIQFRNFQTWEGKTDDSGHAKFDIQLPDYFVGQPLDKGNALVRLEVKLTDTADHTETISKTYPVSNQPIRVSLLPEGGKLVPDMDNRVFVAAVYPDGSPAACDVQVWLGKESKGKPLAQVRTASTGLAELHLHPKAKQFRQGPPQQQAIEMAGGQRQTIWAP